MPVWLLVTDTAVALLDMFLWEELLAIPRFQISNVMTGSKTVSLAFGAFADW